MIKACTFLVIILSGLFLTACQSPRSRSIATPAELLAVAGFYKPYLVYQKAPYTTLYIEVDAVETAVPEQVWLDTLQRYLEKVVKQKVTIYRSDVIPAEEARGRSSTALALEHMDGPPDADAAYMYLHYYDSDVTSDPKTEPRAMVAPHPSSIGIDCQYGPRTWGQQDQLHGRFLIHETSHLLGLTRNKKHGDGLHCTNEGCIMNAAIQRAPLRLLVGRDPWLQKGPCLADLQAYRTQPAPVNLRFLGPYFVRSEKAYHVLTLPGFAYIHVGDLDTIDREHLRSARKQATGASSEQNGFFISTGAMDLETTERVIPLLRQDPYSAIRPIAGDLQRKVDEIRNAATRS
ncbi:MAG: hypothetical protein ACI9QL_001465 [Candidatus Omnitrophota bacterium]|jgi:hypothetical protein